MFVVLVVVAVCAAATDRFYIEDFEIGAGETVQVEMLLENEMVYTAFQCDLYLPEGLSAANFKLTSRKHSSHTLSVTTQPDGASRLLSYSLQLKPYSGNSGALVTFNVTASEEFRGPAVIALRNVMFSNLEGDEMPLADEECTVTAPACGLVGDVDGDGQIDISDVVDLIDCLLSSDASAIIIGNADVNGDGLVNIADVTDLIDQLMSN